MIIKYIENHLKLDLFVTLNINLIENMPTKNATTKETISPHQLTTICSPNIHTLTISKISEPTIIGKLTKKENFVLFSRFAPEKSPAEMVAPERDIPGKIANP